MGRAVEANYDSLKRLWRMLDHLMGKRRPPVSPSVTAEDFNCYFEQKVTAVQAITIGAAEPGYNMPAHPGATFSSFRVLSTDDIISAAQLLLDKSSTANPLPVNMLQQIVDDLAPHLTETCYKLVCRHV